MDRCEWPSSRGWFTRILRFLLFPVWLETRRWKIPVVDDFTIQDAEAREHIHEFYASEDGWNQEQTARFDIELLMWRVFAGEHCRGIQEQRHTKGHFKR